MSKLSKSTIRSQGWEDYRGDYDKCEYDVVSDGYVYFNCWPNAGTFHHMKTGHVIQGEAVELFRKSKDGISMTSTLNSEKGVNNG